MKAFRNQQVRDENLLMAGNVQTQLRFKKCKLIPNQGIEFFLESQEALMSKRISFG